MGNAAIKFPENSLLKPSEAFALLQELSVNDDGSAPPEGKTFEARQNDLQLNSKEWFGVSLATLQQATDTPYQLGLLIAADLHKELIHNPVICQVPFCPTWIEGFINVRGRVAPVLNLQKFFQIQANNEDLNTAPNGSKKPRVRQLLYIDLQSNPFAIELSGFPEKIMQRAVRVNENQAELPPLLQDCIGQTYVLNGLWCEWNIDAFQRRVSEMYNTG